MTINNFYEQKFILNDSPPVYIKNYRPPYSQRKEINRQVNNLVENDLNELSSSNINSPYLITCAVNEKLIAYIFVATYR